MNHYVTAVIPSIPPRAELLRRAIASVLVQTHPVRAISVAIDTDREGAAVTRNRALVGAHSEWCAFLDDDDTWYPQHIQRLCEHQAATGADVVFPWFDVVGGSDPFPENFGKTFDPAHPHTFPITALCRYELAMEVGGFPITPNPGGIGAGEDWNFWKLIFKTGAKVVHLPERTWVWHHDTPGGNTGGLSTRW